MGDNVQTGAIMDYTTLSPVDCGDVVVIENMVCPVCRGVTATDITLGRKATVYTEGVHKLPKVTGALSQGEIVYWDEDGTPVGGEATGAITSTSTSNIQAGFVFADAESSDTEVSVKLGFGPLPT